MGVGEWSRTGPRARLTRSAKTGTQGRGGRRADPVVLAASTPVFLPSAFPRFVFPSLSSLQRLLRLSAFPNNNSDVGEPPEAHGSATWHESRSRRRPAQSVQSGRQSPCLHTFHELGLAWPWKCPDSVAPLSADTPPTVSLNSASLRFRAAPVPCNCAWARTFPSYAVCQLPPSRNLLCEASCEVGASQSVELELLQSAGTGGTVGAVESASHKVRATAARNLAQSQSLKGPVFMDPRRCQLSSSVHSVFRMRALSHPYVACSWVWRGPV